MGKEYKDQLTWKAKWKKFKEEMNEYLHSPRHLDMGGHEINQRIDRWLEKRRNKNQKCSGCDRYPPDPPGDKCSGCTEYDKHRWPY